MRVMCRTRVKLLSFGTREFAVAFKVLKDKVESFMFLFPSTIESEVLKLNSNEPLHSYAIQSLQSVCNLNTGLQRLQVFNEYWRATMAGSGHHNMSGCLDSLKEIFWRQHTYFSLCELLWNITQLSNKRPNSVSISFGTDSTDTPQPVCEKSASHY